MRKFKYLIIPITIIVLGFIAGTVLTNKDSSYDLENITRNGGLRVLYDLPVMDEGLLDIPSTESSNNIEEKKSVVSSNNSHASIPFTSQAPFGEWYDPVFDGACEEASIVMAMHWALGDEKSLTPDYAKEKIQSIADFEEENYGYFYDTSAEDTAKIIRKYYNYKKVTVFHDIDKKDIKRELEKGNVLIVPVNGQILKNPFYTAPGPIAHTIVIFDYDELSGEFITHDPGTKRGDSFRYDEDILESSLQDYPSGYYEAIDGVRTAMIVVEKGD